MRVFAALLVPILALAARASGQPVASSVEPEPSEPPVRPEPARAPTTVTVDTPEATAAPNAASGVAHDDARPTAQRMLWLPRAVLFLPRIAVWAASQPIRGAAYAYEEYDVSDRFTEATFNKQRTFGIYPTASYETGFGFTIGARLLYKDVFDRDERLKLRVNFGGRFRQAYGLNFKSGERFGKDFTLELDTSYERRPQERFYGIGNDNDAIGTRFRETFVRNMVTLDLRITDAIHARTSGALMLREFSGTDEDDSLTNHYDTTALPGWDTGVDNIYVEQELRYDTRRPTSRYQSRALDATGWLASLYGGMATGVRDDPSEFYRYGGEVQRYFDLYDGSRVLAVRALVEAVGGDHVTFIDLPRLGGNEYLRGYPNGRFRDNAIALATAEYTWDLGNYLAAYTFVDVGRPAPSLGELGIEEPRMGYGGGIQLHTRQNFLMRAQIAASVDGDVFLELALSPAFGRRERAGRY